MSPIIRKVYEISGSKVISLPKSWLEWFQRKYDCEIKEVAIEVNKVLIIEPILSSKKEQNEQIP